MACDAAILARLEAGRPDKTSPAHGKSSASATRSRLVWMRCLVNLGSGILRWQRALACRYCYGLCARLFKAAIPGYRLGAIASQPGSSLQELAARPSFKQTDPAAS